MGEPTSKPSPHASSRELSLEELDQEADREQQKQKVLNSNPAGRERGPLLQPPHLAKPPRDELWEYWRKDRIWVHNGTGSNILVYVHRFRKIREIIESGVKLSGGAPGTVGVEAALKACLEKGLMQEFSIPADYKEWQRVFLGSGSGGAYVTTRSAQNKQLLFCRDYHVKGAGAPPSTTTAMRMMYSQRILHLLATDRC